MDAITVTLRAEALTTPARARALGAGAGLATVHENALIYAINTISQAVASYCERPLHQVTVDEDDPELLQGHGREQLQLRSYPVAWVESVTVNGCEVCDFSRAKQFLRKGTLYREKGWPWSVPRHCDLTGDPDFSRPRYNVGVCYTGGFITPAQVDLIDGEYLPDEIEQAVIREMGDLLTGARNTGRIRREKTAGGYEVEFALSAVVSLSRETQSVLGPYVWAGLP